MDDDDDEDGDDADDDPLGGGGGSCGGRAGLGGSVRLRPSELKRDQKRNELKRSVESLPTEAA